MQLFNYTFKHVEEQYGHDTMKSKIDRFFTRVSFAQCNTFIVYHRLFVIIVYFCAVCVVLM